jgi:hypothetical protein
MRKTILLILTSVAVLCAQFTPDDSTRLSFPIVAFSRAGERKIEARAVYLDTFGRKGQPIKRNLFVVFDPATGYFLFAYAGLGNVQEAIESDSRLIQSDTARTTVHSAAYISERGILLVAPGKPSLGITQSNERATSLDDAEHRAVRTLGENVLDAARAVEWPTTKQVPLLNREGVALLPPHFYSSLISVVAGPITVVGIAQTAEGWDITLQGQYRARVTISPSFEALKAERIDPPTR